VLYILDIIFKLAAFLFFSKRLPLSWNWLVDSEFKLLLNRTASDIAYFKLLYTLFSGIIVVPT